jgi:hypothetical protein
MRAVFRTLVIRLLAAVLLLAACGAPPEALPTAPPPVVASAGPPSAVPSALPSAYSSALPSAYPAPTGTAGVPTYPAPRLPTYPAATLPAVTSTTTSRAPSPAPSCAHGPTAAQVIAVVRTRPGIPTGPRLDAKQGPFCAGTWQFTVLGEAGKTLDEVDPLLVVTTGRPRALTVVEAGADVCSSHVENAAPTGIRVLACGS